VLVDELIRPSCACVQMRPVMGKDEGDSATHSWSIGAYGGQHTLHLDAISDGTTRLISCPPANGSAESDAGVSSAVTLQH